LQRYKTAYDRELEKRKNSTLLWNSDPEKYECYVKTNFACPSMPVRDMKALPERYQNACAPSFLIVGTAKSGIVFMIV
jgi:hypothetical protein